MSKSESLDSNPDAWIYLPTSTCERNVGAHLLMVKDPSPAARSEQSN